MVQLRPLEVKRFRVEAATVHASFEQLGQAMARLSGRHIEIEVEGEDSTAPELVLTSPGEEVRRWTLRVENLDPTQWLEGELAEQKRTHQQCVAELQAGIADHQQRTARYRVGRGYASHTGLS